MIGIYEIKNVLNGDCYIGSSVDTEDRKRRHFRDLNKQCHHSTILQRAFNKYGSENFKFSIIEECEENCLIEKEQYYLDNKNPKYNISKMAGGGCLGYKHSEETKEKLRKQALDNSTKPPESTWKDRQESVLMLDYNTLEILNIFESLSAACRFVGKDSTFASTISNCCKNKRYSAYGYRWAFKEEDISILRTKKEIVPWNKGKNVKSSKRKKVYQYDLAGNFLKEWNSVKEAELEIGKGVGNCARGKSKTSNGFIWKYEKE